MMISRGGVRPPIDSLSLEEDYSTKNIGTDNSSKNDMEDTHKNRA
jgi:hypothetical protein